MKNSSFFLSLFFNERDKNTSPWRANLKEELSLLLFQVKLRYLFDFTDILLHSCLANAEGLPKKPSVTLKTRLHKHQLSHLLREHR